MPPIETFDEAGLPDHLAWQAVACMREAWPSLFTGGLAWITRPAPARARPRHFTVSHRGVLISYASVIELTVTPDGPEPDGPEPDGPEPDRPEPDGQELLVYGLGNVLTASPYRGRGHATRVLGGVNRWLDTAGGDLAGLFCGPGLVPFYARAGWTECPGGTRLGRRGDRYDGIRMMRFLSGRARASRAALVGEPLRVPHPW